MQLRPYQEKAILDIKEELRAGRREVLLTLPTGAGKTAISSIIVQGATSKNVPNLFLVHRQEIIAQTSVQYAEIGLHHDIIAPAHVIQECIVRQLAATGRSFYRPGSISMIGSIQTVQRRLDRIMIPKVIIWDECQYCAAAGYQKVHEYYRPHAVSIGLTATPERLDGKGLDFKFQSMVLGPSVKELIEQGYLSPFKHYAPPNGIDMNAIKIKMGEYDADELMKEINKRHLTGNAVEHYLKMARGKKGIAFCVNRAHSEQTAKMFNEAGIRAAHLDGETDKKERSETLRRYERGEVDILCNCNLFSEGFNVPTVEVVILLAPTKSLAKYLQQIGRGMRRAPGKEFLFILDHANNVLQHGLVNQPRLWTLEGRKTKKRAVDPAAKVISQCPVCYHIHEACNQCPECGHYYNLKPVGRKEIDTKEGELIEVTAEWSRGKCLKSTPLRVLLKDARTEAQLQQIAEAKGYKKGWVNHVLSGKAHAYGKRRKNRSAPMGGQAEGRLILE